MHHAVIWLLVFEILGLIALPLTYVLFRRLPDRGIIFSKILALLLVAYIFWLLGHTRVIPNSQYTIIGILVVLATISAVVWRRKASEIVPFIKRNWVPIAAAELIFLGFFFIWILIASQSPGINHTEKPMDFAFLNAVLVSDHFPPEDPWLAGHSISYYYFGHFMMATLTKLTAIPSNVSYNLSIALVAAMAGAAVFSLVYNLIRVSGAKMSRSILFALSAPLLLVLIGNLEGVLEFVNAQGWGSAGFWNWVSIKGLGATQGADAAIFPDDHWWWWRGTRVIDTLVDGQSRDFTITEFPFFSFLLGDLHAHLSSLPFILLNLALGLNLMQSKGKLGLQWLRNNLWETFATMLALGSLAFINIWDYPVVAAVLIVLILLKSYTNWGGQDRRFLLSAAYVAVPIIAVSYLLYLPFHMSFTSQAAGVLPVERFSTSSFHFMLIWGLMLVLTGAFFIRQLWSIEGVRWRNPGELSLALIISLLPFLLWAGLELTVRSFGGSFWDDIQHVGSRFVKLLPAMVIVAVAIYYILLRYKHDVDQPTGFALLLLVFGLYLIIGAELFRLVDLFGNRMNTVFKTYYEAWLFLAVVSAYSLYYVSSRPLFPEGWANTGLFKLIPKSGWIRPGLLAVGAKYGWISVVSLLLLGSLYYSIGAAWDRTRTGSQDGSLDGLAFIKGYSLDEYKAIQWLREKAPDGRIVEAVGSDYSDFGRISSSTGRPTVIGWRGHEHQWRGSTAPFSGRDKEVEQIFQSDDPDTVLALLDKYDIRYVYVGRRERTTYGASNFGAFTSLLKPAFQSDDVVIYEKAPDNSVRVASGTDAI